MLGEFDRRILQRYLVRDPLLEQQIGRLHSRIVVKAPLHREVVERVVERHERHALVMRHEGAEHDAALGSSPAAAPA